MKIVKKYTPGPWIAKKCAGWFITRPNAGKREAALKVGMTAATALINGETEDEERANTFLMAAAPEMAEALIEEVKIYDGMPEEMMCDGAKLAFAALRKAGILVDEAEPVGKGGEGK